MEKDNTQISSFDDSQTEIINGKRPLPISAAEAFAEVSSKKDLYDHMANNLQYYMPSYEMFTKDFAKLIFSDQKRLLKLRDVKFVNVTRYDELSVKNLYPKYMTLEGFHLYFPTKYPKGRQCDREYMFNVANTLYEEITQEMIQHANKERNAIDADAKKQDAVLMSDHWKEELRSLPMSISKKGKMVALLKQKSKVAIQHKPRVKHEIKNIFKRPKIDESLTQVQRDAANKELGLSNAGRTAKKIEATVIQKFDVNMNNQETKK